MSETALLLPSLKSIEANVPREGLQYLRPIHLKIISLYFEGRKNSEIARIVGVSPQTVSNVRNDPIVRNMLAELQDSAKRDLAALMPQAVEVVAGAMKDGDIKEQLTAADKVFKANKVYNDDSKDAATAEDVMKRIIDHAKTVQIQVNNYGSGEQDARQD